MKIFRLFTFSTPSFIEVNKRGVRTRIALSTRKEQTTP